METTDIGKAKILNELFATIGEKLANELPRDPNQDTLLSHISRVTPTIMNVNVSHERVADSIAKLEPNKSCGPDNVAPKLIKLAGMPLFLPYYLFSQEVHTAIL